METIKIQTLLFWLILACNGFTLDLDLAKAIQIATEQNLNLQGVRSQAQSAEVQSSLAHSSLGPTLSTGADISQTKRLDERGAGSRWGADLTLSQSVDFSKFTSAKSKALSAHAAKMQANSSELDVTGNIIMSYLQFLRDSLLIQVSEQDHKTQQEKWSFILAEVQAGSRSNAEALQQEAVVAQAETNVLQRIRSAQDRKSDFVSVLGTGISADTVRIIFPPSILTHSIESLDIPSLQKDTIKASSSIESQNLRILAAKESMRSTEQQKLPTLSFSASLNHEDPIWNNPQGNTESSQYLRLQARIQLKIIDGGARNAQMQQDQLSIEDAERAKLQLQNEESIAIRKALRQLETSQAMRASAQKSLTASQKALESMRAQYQLGAANLLDVRQTEQQELSAQATLLDTQFECLISYVLLRNAQNRIDQVLAEFSTEIQP